MPNSYPFPSPPLITDRLLLLFFYNWAVSLLFCIISVLLTYGSLFRCVCVCLLILVSSPLFFSIEFASLLFVFVALLFGGALLLGSFLAIRSSFCFFCDAFV